MTRGILYSSTISPDLQIKIKGSQLQFWNLYSSEWVQWMKIDVPHCFVIGWLCALPQDWPSGRDYPLLPFARQIGRLSTISRLGHLSRLANVQMHPNDVLWMWFSQQTSKITTLHTCPLRPCLATCLCPVTQLRGNPGGSQRRQGKSHLPWPISQRPFDPH